MKRINFRTWVLFFFCPIVVDRYFRFRFQLRPLTDMTLKEAKHILQMRFPDVDLHGPKLTAIPDEEEGNITITAFGFIEPTDDPNKPFPIKAQCVFYTTTEQLFTAEEFLYFTRRQFDVFGWIEKGYAMPVRWRKGDIND